MTHQVSGVVEQGTTKTVKTKFGDKPVYGIIVDGVEVSTGFKRDHNQGEMVDLRVEWKFNNWQKIGVGGTANLPKATAGGPGGGNAQQGNFVKKQAGGSRAGGFPVNPTDGSMSIIRQNSMTHATKLVRDMVDVGVLSLSTVDEYMKEVLETALSITDYSSGQDGVKLKAAIEANQQVMDR